MTTTSSAHRAQSVDALWERVENHGSAIRALGEETAIQFRDLRAEMSRTNTELSATLKALDTKFDASAARVAEQQRPQYLGIIGAMFAAITVTVTIVSILSNLHDRPVDDKLAALTTSIADLTKATSNSFSEVAKATVSQSEYKLTTDFTNRISDLKTTAATDRSARIQNQLDKVDADLVPRAEHQFHWEAESKIDTRLQDEITALQQQISQLAPPADVLKRLGDREHELEMRVFGTKTGG